MGNFPGHILPGLCFMLMALLLFLRSLRDVRALDWLRASRAGILLSPAAKTATGVLGICAEIVDMLYHDSLAGSHFEHLKLLTLITGMGVVEYLHMRRFLTGPAWPYLQPACLLLISVMLSSHQQEHDLMVLYHQLSAFLSLLMSLSLAGEVTVALHGKHVFCGRGEEAPSAGSSEWPAELRDLNPMYFNHAVYATALPACTAVLLFVNGTWWWQMAFSFFMWMGEIPEKYLDGGHAYMYMLGVFFNHAVGVVLAAAVIEMVLHRMDGRGGSAARRQSTHAADEGEMMVPMGEDKLS